ncbi:hypothetical protein F5883DRAFT_230080 [Diaporthe sp. PMI_573]|nr:hypothetical protein F5883DRAFT_230080 [Diaporthaceae sp. PMI_573]
MKLLNTRTLQIHEVTLKPPPYATLSYFWGGTFNEWTIPDSVQLQRACTETRRLGLEWLWLQGLCIDRSSAFETSECINSLFGIFKGSVVCLVYLGDASVEAGETTPLIAGSILRQSLWLQRIWSLTELIASKDVFFFDSKWRQFGTKLSLLHEISDATRIDRHVLEDSDCLTEISVARRMSWASSCSCDREEDLAYALIGLFGVRMTIQYGEGYRAFLRLQEEIMSTTDDASLLCWQAGTHAAHGYRGLLAHSPAEFGHFALIPPIAPLHVHGDLKLTSDGVIIENVSLSRDIGFNIVLPLYSDDGKARYGMCLTLWKGRYVKPYLGFTRLDVDTSQTVRQICIMRDVDSRMSGKVATELLETKLRRSTASREDGAAQGRLYRNTPIYNLRSQTTAISVSMGYKPLNGESHYCLLSWSHVFTHHNSTPVPAQLSGCACCRN